MPTKTITRACLLAIAALTLCALLLQARADILSADSSDWHAAPQNYHLHWVSLHPYSVLDTFHFADMVAHVKLKSIRAEAQQDWGSNYYPEIEGSTSYDPEIWFEFDVLEYFKGSGSDKIWGIVDVEDISVPGGQPTAIAARAVATQYIRRTDPLHTGEAVVFMKESDNRAPRTRQSDHYYLGQFNAFGHEEYSLAALRLWLPLASSNSISGSSEEPQFMLKHPDGNIWGYPEEELGTVGAPDNSVITLSELRYIAKNEQSLMEQTARNNINRQIRMAAQNLTAEATKDAITLRWNVESLPDIPVLDTTRSYRVLRQAIDKDDEDPFYAYVEGVLGYPVLQYSDTDLTELADEIPASASMSYEDKLDISPGTKYVYLVRTLRFGNYFIDTLVMITATDGATATGTILPATKLSTDTPTPTPTPSPAALPTSGDSLAVQ